MVTVEAACYTTLAVQRCKANSRLLSGGRFNICVENGMNEGNIVLRRVQSTTGVSVVIKPSPSIPEVT